MHESSVRRITGFIVWFDITINYLLGAWLLFAPNGFDRLIGASTVMPLFFYRIIGIGLLLFAIWQTIMIRSNKIFTNNYLLPAIILAVIPVIILAAALLFGDFPVKPAWKMILWIGDLYMILLSAWYIRVLQIQARKAAP